MGSMGFKGGFFFISLLFMFLGDGCNRSIEIYVVDPWTRAPDPTTPCLSSSSAISHPSHQTPLRHLFSVSALYISTSSMSSCNAANFPCSSAADSGMFASARAKREVLRSSMRAVAARMLGCGRGSLQRWQCLLGDPER